MLRACHAPSNSSLSDSGNLSKAWPKVQCLDAIVLIDWVRGCDFTVAPKYPEKLAEYRGQK